MKRSFLEELGIEDKAVIDKIMAENGQDIEAAKAPDRQAEIDGLKEQLKERDKQLETLSKSKDNVEDLKAQIEALQTQNKDAATKHEAEMTALKIESAVQKALTQAGAKNLKAVSALLDLSNAELTEDGGVKNLDKQIKSLMDAEDSRFLFNESQPKLKGAKPGEPSGTSTSGMTKDQILSMNDPAERIQAIQQNPQLFRQ